MLLYFKQFNGWLLVWVSCHNFLTRLFWLECQILVNIHFTLVLPYSLFRVPGQEDTPLFSHTRKWLSLKFCPCCFFWSYLTSRCADVTMSIVHCIAAIFMGKWPVTSAKSFLCLSFQGCLPLVLMFDMKEEIEVEPQFITQLMEQLDVFISIKPKPKQPSKVCTKLIISF